MATYIGVGCGCAMVASLCCGIGLYVPGHISAARKRNLERVLAGEKGTEIVSLPSVGTCAEGVVAC